ncbi:MAG: hypothetical protein JOZ54_10470 [Acidobacteria bacterium]|nr:hypothetical protein [Acidobacteriota bacterium]
MKIVCHAVAALLAASLLACGEGEEKRRQQEQLSLLEAQSATVARRLATQTRALSDARDRLLGLRSELALHNTETLQYIQAHQVSVSCLRNVDAAFGRRNVYAAQASEWSKSFAVVCSVGLLNRTFADQVSASAQYLQQADRRANSLKDQIATLEKSVENLRQDVRRSQDAVDRITTQLVRLHQPSDSR